MEIIESADYDDLCRFILNEDLYLICTNHGVYKFQYKDKLYSLEVLGNKITRTNTLVIDTWPDENGQFKVEVDYWDWTHMLIA